MLNFKAQISYKHTMKKTLLIFLFIATAMIGAKAQIGGGYNFAMNFGGAGSEVRALQIDAQGNTYFLANIYGKAVFAGQQIDGGAIGNYPNLKSIFGKIAADGTQSLIKILPQATSMVTISQTGELYAFYVGNNNIPVDFGNGVNMNTWGFYLIKFSNTGEAQYIKKVTIGNTDYQYGNSGIAIPGVHGMQVTPDGNLYVGISSANLDSSAPDTSFKYPYKVAKYDLTGNEVWHNDLYSKTVGSIAMPTQFVSNDGRATFAITSNTNQWYFNGASIASEMSNYANSLYTYIISLNPDGTKNFAIADGNNPTLLKSVNPTNGDLYLYYGTATLASAPTKAPFTSLPNQYPGSNPYNYYLFGGLLTFNNSGTYIGYTTKIADNKIFKSDNGFLVYEDGYTNSPIDKGGSYVFNDDKQFGVLSYYDESFNFLKALKTPRVALFAANGSKVSLTNPFKGNLQIGNTTLSQSYNDTDFETRFPTFASIKADMFIIQAEKDNIVAPVASNWLGTDNNWNNPANWSDGKVPSAASVVNFNTPSVNMPTTATSPTALKITIADGVNAQLPANLTIKNKLIINGTLQINHSGALSFTNYSATAIEGTGILSFNGTAGSSVTAYNLIGYKDLTLSTNENITIAQGIYKNISFTGTNAVITASGGLEITSPAVNAIAGFGNTNYIAGDITRAVNSTGTYTFPNKRNFENYEPTTLTLNNLTGVQKIKVANPSSTNEPNLKFPSGTTTTKLGGSYTTYWTISADAEPTGGTYDVTFEKSVFSNGVTDADRYVVLKRPDVNSLWSFEGTKTASTQTGGTTSGQTVSDATVTAGLSGLTKFSDFIIGINSAPVPTGTAVTNSNWTGASNTEWNNAANWSSGTIPNGLTQVTIPAGLANYPAIYTVNDNAKSLTIEQGVTGLKLSSVLVLNNGLINNADIEIAKLSGFSSVFNGYGGGISGSGKIRFEANGGILSTIAGNVANDVEVNVGNANSFNLLGKFGGNIIIKSGLVNAWKSGSAYLEQTNSAKTVQIAAPINAIAAEKLIKAVNTSGTYSFPLGDFQYHRIQKRKYGEIVITTNGIASPSVYSVVFDSYSTAPVALTNGSDLISSFVNSGQWSVNPSVFSTTGTIDIALKTSDYTNGRVNTSDYVLLRRASTSVNSSDVWTIVPGATISESAGTITATASGIAPFSTNTMFCIGLKATTTTWTGATSTDWNVASNWSNGVPSTMVKAIIANASRYPNNPPTSGSAAAAIEIASGSAITLPTTFYTPSGIINNGTIKVSGSGTFNGFGNYPNYSGLNGNGKLVFDASSPTSIDSYYTNATINNSIELNNSAGLNFTRATKLGGDLNLINGKITFSSGRLTMTNPTASASGSANGYVVGVLERNVNPSGTYNFPVGLANAYTPASLILDGLTGVTSISTNFSDIAVSNQPNLTINGQSITSLLSDGSWFITPNAQPTAGSYSASLTAMLGSSTASKFYVLKRPDNYSAYPWANLGTNVTSTVTTGMVTASVAGLTSFSQFAIGEGFGALPVKITKFLASADAKFAKLYWETASELNNDKFEVERSTNGRDFFKIGELDGNGTSQKLNTYSFKDLAPTNGLNYYRLKQVDFNGNFEYSEARAVKFDLKDVVFRVYPNPATEIINFSESLKSVEIYTLNGAKVYEQIATVSTVKIPSVIKPGIYVVKAILLNGSSVSKQIIIK